MPAEFTAEITIKAPRSVVAAAINDPQNAPMWNDTLVSVEILEGTPGQVGVKALLTYAQGDASISMTETMIACIPEEMYEGELVGPFMTIKVTTTLNDTPNGDTHMVLRWVGTSEHISDEDFQKIIDESTQDSAIKDLNTLREMIETRGAKFYQ